VEGAGAHFDIVGLEDNAALFRPEPLQIENQRLETQGSALGIE
jgi:hypothetical protein